MMSAVMLTPSGDTYISRWYSNTNFSDRKKIVAGIENWRKNVYNGLLKFDLPQIPAGSQLIRAGLRLYVNEVVFAQDVTNKPIFLSIVILPVIGVSFVNACC